MATNNNYTYAPAAVDTSAPPPTPIAPLDRIPAPVEPGPGLGITASTTPAVVPVQEVAVNPAGASTVTNVKPTVPNYIEVLLDGNIIVKDATAINFTGSGVAVTANGAVATMTITSGGTYGNSNVSTLLAGFGSNTLVTTGNITAGYFIGNGSQLTGLAATYGNSNVTTLLAALGSNIISGTGNITTTANISGGFILGNGSQLTGIAASYGNANVVANLAALGSNPVSTTGNITGGNILGGANVNATTHTGTTVSVTGNVTGGNITTAGLVVTTGNVSGGNIIAATLVQSATVSASGNVTGGNILTGAQVVANGVIQTGTGFSTGGYLSVNGTTDLHDTTVTGNLSVSVIRNNDSTIVLIEDGVDVDGNVTADYFVGNGSQLANITANSTQVTYSQGDAGSVQRTVASKFQETASVKDFGAVGDGVTNDTAAITAAITATTSGTLIFPEGSYLINNSTGPFTVSSFQGEMIFLGNAKLLFNTNTQAGIVFSGGSNAKIYNIRIDYVTPPASRTNAQEGIAFYSTTDTTVTGVYVESSPAAGLLFGQCIRPQVSGVVIESSQADGVHFNNCQDPQIDNLITVSTGDDGLAFVNYASQANYSGGTATNIIIRNSKSRGIAVVGQSNVTVSNFLVDGTASSGIFTAYDSAYSTRYPANVIWSDGIVRNAGTVTPLVGNQFGIEYADVVSVKYNNIKVINSASRGMSGTTAANGLIEASDITVDSATTNNGFNLSGVNISIDNLFANNIPSYGIYISNSTNVQATNLKTLNVSTGGGLNRAVWFDTVVQLLADGIEVIDNQGSATGYIVGSANCTRGSVSSVNFAIANGTGQINPVDSGISYPLTNYGPNSTNILFGTGAISGTGNITAGNILTGGLISATGNITGGNVTTAGLISATGTITSAANIAGGNITTAGLITATGNISGNFILGNGSLLTGIAASSYGNANVVANLAALGSNPVSTTGNITGGNILGGANVNATTHTGTTVSVTANVTGGNILTAGLISATSTITSAANVVGGNITTGGQVSATANITGGNILTAGLISATGNISGGNLIVTGIVVDNTANLDLQTTATNGNINFITDGTGIVATSAAVSAGGNITGGNLITAGLATVTGNITGGNLNTGAQVVATGNITGGNLITAGQVTATGNVTGGNLNVTGNIVDTGALTIITAASGNISLAPNGTTVLTVATTGIVANVSTTTTATPANGVGYIGMPVSSVTNTGTLTIADAGKLVYVTAASQTVTIPANGSVAFPIGTAVTFIAGPSATTVLIAITTDTMYLGGTGTTGTRTLAAYGMATAVKVASTTWYINGTGLT